MKITAKVTEKNPVHSRLSVWVNGGLIVNPGGICLRNDEVEGFLDHLKISPTKIKAKIGQMMDEYRRIGKESGTETSALEKRIALQVVLNFIEQEEKPLDLNVQGWWEVTDKLGGQGE